MGVGCSGRSSDTVLSSVPEIPRLKIVLVGDVEVGKTSIFLRYFKNQFDYSYRPTNTVNIENIVKKLNVPENTVVSVTIWDLPGREEVDLRRSYYRDVDAAVVVVNISDPGSVELAGTWKQDVLNHADYTNRPSNNNTPNIPVLLLGNKFDIVEERLSKLENSHAVEKDVRQSPKEQTDESEQSLKKNEGVVEQLRMACNDDPPTEGQGKDDSERQGKDDPERQGKDDPITENKSEEVLRLEECSNQHGFIGCVAVSAKESTGVHTAIQALVRHLIEQKLKDKAEQKMTMLPIKEKKRKQAKKLRLKEFNLLETTDVEKIDKIFEQCNPGLYLIHECKLAFEHSLREFKLICRDSGVIEGKKSSIEECIVGLRDVLMKEGIELVVDEQDGLIEISLSGQQEDFLQNNLHLANVFNMFQSEVSLSCQTIIKDFPSVLHTLEYHERAVSTESSALIKEFMEAHPEMTMKNSNIISEKIDMNRARIKHSQMTAKELIEEVEGLITKIKTAMIW